MWETCHQMSWVWLKGSEAGPLHPTMSRREKNVIKTLLLAQHPPSKDSCLQLIQTSKPERLYDIY